MWIALFHPLGFQFGLSFDSKLFNFLFSHFNLIIIRLTLCSMLIHYFNKNISMWKLKMLLSIWKSLLLVTSQDEKYHFEKKMHFFSLSRFYYSGIDMSSSNYDGRTALHLAAAEGHSSCIKFLVETCKLSPLTKDR